MYGQLVETLYAVNAFSTFVLLDGRKPATQEPTAARLKSLNVLEAFHQRPQASIPISRYANNVSHIANVETLSTLYNSKAGSQIAGKSSLQTFSDVGCSLGGPEAPESCLQCDARAESVDVGPES